MRSDVNTESRWNKELELGKGWDLADNDLSTSTCPSLTSTVECQMFIL